MEGEDEGGPLGAETTSTLGEGNGSEGKEEVSPARLLRLLPK